MSSPPPPPPLPELDHATPLSVKQRLSKKSRFSFSSHKKKQKLKNPAIQTTLAPSTPPTTIKLNVPPLSIQDEYHDLYRWAVLYENQRGLTFFSIPYYSSNSLLPSDPAPFTMPGPVQIHQPNVSLTEYPLPDGNWHWVSKSWMVDMRSDSGQVQYDGFEYNCWFRQHHWRAQVGPCSAGGWVRRRRWVRLMMRPGKKRRLAVEEEEAMNEPPTPTVASSSLGNSWNGWDKRLSTPSPSVLTNVTSRRDTFYLPEIWQGNVNDDWSMCRDIMRATSSDGAKLELWKRWLGLADPEPVGKGKQKANNNDAESVEWPVVPPIEYVTAVLRAKLTTVLQDFFIFPESRRGFIELLFKANVFDQVSGLEHKMTLVKALEFWSLNSELHLIPPSLSMPS
ncbi:hypothetical protein GYMLUDRAFT_235382 [Collybiopsis luxurians FD-317 M1]|nr:hypothetical protein GYMLUDRAFT_235382 [Collybiopsis luxurians FD-317 M1]